MNTKGEIIFCPIHKGMLPFAPMAAWMGVNRFPAYTTLLSHRAFCDNGGGNILSMGHWFRFENAFLSQCVRIEEASESSKFSVSFDPYWVSRHMDLARFQCDQAGTSLKFVKFESSGPALPEAVEIYNNALEQALQEYAEYRHKNKDTGYCLATDAVISAPYPN
jgi:hypothetical protein